MKSSVIKYYTNGTLDYLSTDVKIEEELSKDEMLAFSKVIIKRRDNEPGREHCITFIDSSSRSKDFRIIFEGYVPDSIINYFI